VFLQSHGVPLLPLPFPDQGALAGAINCHLVEVKSDLYLARPPKYNPSVRGKWLIMHALAWFSLGRTLAHPWYRTCLS
jgi:hypothetical protein